VRTEGGAVAVSAWQEQQMSDILCAVDRAFLSNLVNKTSLVHNLFLVYLSISTCFGRLWACHQEKQLYFCDTTVWMTGMQGGYPAYQTVIHTE